MSESFQQYRVPLLRYALRFSVDFHVCIYILMIVVFAKFQLAVHFFYYVQYEVTVHEIYLSKTDGMF